ncbi:glycoside hydrolase family 70 protein [Lactobacillaceae bacterium Melli_B4]
MNLNTKDTKIHYKMYKSGKKWIISGITTAAILITVSDFNAFNQVSADTQTNLTTSINNGNNKNTVNGTNSTPSSSSAEDSKSSSSVSGSVQSSSNSADSKNVSGASSSAQSSSSAEDSKSASSASSSAQPSSSAEDSKSASSASSSAQSSSSAGDSKNASSASSSAQPSSSSVDSKSASSASSNAQSSSNSENSKSSSSLGDISNRDLSSTLDSPSSLPTGGNYETTDGGKTWKYIYKNSPIKGLYEDKGNLLYFDGYDGTQARGTIYNINNDNYVFDKSNGYGTKIDEISGGQYKEQQENNNWVYQKSDNSLAKGIQSIDGNLRYFNPTDGSQLKGGAANIAGADYYFEPNQGDLIGNVDQSINSGKYVSSNGNTQYVDSNNNTAKGLTVVNGTLNYFDKNTGNQVKNQQVYTNGATYYFDDNGNGQYLFTNNGNSLVNDISKHNVVNSTNLSDYKNTVDGFLTADTWYRPKDILDGGSTWRPSTDSDYRPIITNWWPNKNVQVNYLKLMQDNGLLSSQTQYNRFTDQSTLDEAAQSAQVGIEQRIKQENSTDWLNNLLFNGSINNPSFMNKQFVWNVSSEYPNQGGDQWFQGGYLKYQNSSLTPNTNSNYRNADNTFEFLLANDVDNSNPAVQAEDLNWLHYLMNFGSITNNDDNANFDGIRVDAISNISTDATKRTFDYLREKYNLTSNDAVANKHLSIVEGDMNSGPAAVNSNALIVAPFSGDIQQSLTNGPGSNSSLSNLIKEMDGNILVVDHADQSKDSVPNYSFVHAHDMGIQDSLRVALKDSTGADWTNFTPEQLKTGLDTYYNDQRSVTKKYNFYNVPSSYALMLTNNDTAPRIYYGDLYQDTGQYMQDKSIYYDAITSLMTARKKYVAGGQNMSVDNNGILTSVRFGNGATTANDTGNADTRTEGIGVIVGNDPSINLKDNDTVTLNMGVAHKNQAYRALVLTTKDGIQTYNSDNGAPTAYTDEKGLLTFSNKNINDQANTRIAGTLNPQVSGYLAAWVPVGARADQDARTTPSTTTNTDGNVFHVNAALNSNVMYEGFSNFQPMPTTESERANVVITKNANLFNNWGITDFEMAPQYKSSNDHSFLDSTIDNGYAFADRYDLGYGTPTKYGTVDDLRNAISTLHQSGMQVMADVVYNQLYSLDGKEVTPVARTNVYGNDISLPFGTQLYVTNTIGGGQYQNQYGGAFLNEIKSLYPDLFNSQTYTYYQTGGNTAQRTMKAIPTDQVIKQWSAKYLNGTNILGRGMGYVLKDWNTGKYFKLDGSNTVVPTSLSSSSIYRQGWAENGDGSWSYYDAKDGNRLIGLQDVSGQHLYFNNNGVQVKGQIVDVNGNRMYFDSNYGELLVNSKITIDGVNYHADNNGILSVVNNSSTSNSSNSNSSSSSSSNSSIPNSSSASNSIVATNTGTTITPSISTVGYVAPTDTTTSDSSSSSANSSAASSSATSSSASSASSVASSASSSVSSNSATSSVSSSKPVDNNQPTPIDKNNGAITIAKAAMDKAQKAVKVAEKNKQQSHSKVHVKNYNKAVANYYQAEKAYLKVAKLYNRRYYYDFDQVTKHSKNVKLKKLAFVYDSKKFTKQNRIHKLKKGTKVKVNKIVRHGKTTRFNIGHDKFITGLKSFIHKLTK